MRFKEVIKTKLIKIIRGIAWSIDNEYNKFKLLSLREMSSTSKGCVFSNHKGKYTKEGWGEKKEEKI